MTSFLKYSKTALILLPFALGMTTKSFGADEVAKSENPLKKCWGQDQWLCFEPTLYANLSIGDGHNTPLDSNIRQSQMGLAISKANSNWALVLNWSATAAILRDSVQETANDSVYANRDANLEKVDFKRSSTIAAMSKDLSDALVFAGNPINSPQYNVKYNLLQPIIVQKVTAGVQPYYDKIAYGTAEALKRIDDRSDEQQLRLSARDIFVSYDDGSALFRGGWTRTGQGFDRTPIGDSQLKYTGTGSHALAVKEGMNVQSFGIEGGKKIIASENVDIELVAWVNREGALFVNGTQYLANAYRQDEEMYKHYNDDIFIFNAGGAKSCVALKSTGTDLCASIQATGKGVSPGLRIEQDFGDRLKLFVVATYVNHTLQAEGFHGRVQLTYDAFHLPYNFDVFVSVFAEYSKKQQDFNKVSELDLHSDGYVEDYKEVGGSVVAVKQFNKIQSATSFGVEVKGTEFKMGEATIQEGQVVATFGLEFGKPK